MENLTDLGVGAAVALLILDRVFSFVKALRNGKEDNSAGNKKPEFWLLEYRKMEDTIVIRVEKLLSNKFDRDLEAIRDGVTTLIRWKGGD